MMLIEIMPFIGKRVLVAFKGDERRAFIASCVEIREGRNVWFKNEVWNNDGAPLNTGYEKFYLYRDRILEMVECPDELQGVLILGESL